MHPHVAAAAPAAAGNPLSDGHTAPPREEVLGHLQRYAARTGLLPCIRLNTSLVRARYTRMNCEWRLGLRDAVTGRSWQCSADVLVLCRSAVAAPRPPPPLPGQQLFEGRVVEVEAASALDTNNMRHLDSRLGGKHVVVMVHPMAGAANGPNRRPTAMPPPTETGAVAAGPTCKDACGAQPAAGDAAAPPPAPMIEAVRRLCLAALEHVGSCGSVTLVLEEERPSAGTTRTSATAELGLGLVLAPAWTSSSLTPPAGGDDSGNRGGGGGNGVSCSDQQQASSLGRAGLFSGCFGGACFGRGRGGEPAQSPVPAGSTGTAKAAACVRGTAVALAAAAGDHTARVMSAGAVGAEAVLVDPGCEGKADLGDKVAREHGAATCTSSGSSAAPPEWTADLEAAGARLVLGCPAALQCGCLVLADGAELPADVLFTVFTTNTAAPQPPQQPACATSPGGAKATPCTGLEELMHIDLRFLESAGGGGASVPRQRGPALAAPSSTTAGGGTTTNPNNGTGNAAAGLPSAASVSSFRKLHSHLSLYSLAAGGDSFDSRVEATERSVRAAGGRSAAPFIAGDVLADLYRGMLCTSEAAPNLVFFGEVRPRDHCAVTVALQARWLAHSVCAAADAAAGAAAGTGVDSDMGRGGDGGSRRHSRTASASAPAAAAAAAAPLVPYVRQPSPAEAALDAAKRAALGMHTSLVGRPHSTPGQLAAYQRLLLRDQGLQVGPGGAAGTSGALHSLKQAFLKLLPGGKTAAAAARQPLAPRPAARLLRVRPPPHMTRDEYLDAVEQHDHMRQQHQHQQLQGAAAGAAVWGAASAAAVTIMAGGCADGDRVSAMSRGTSGGLWAHDRDSRATSGRGTPSNVYSTRLSLVTDVDAADFEASALAAAAQLGPLLGAGGSPLMRPPASTRSPSVGGGPGPGPGAGLRSVSASVPGFGGRPSLQLSRRSSLSRSPLAPPQQQQPLVSVAGMDSPWESPSRLSRQQQQQQQLAMLQHASASAGGTASPPRSAASPAGTRHHSISGRLSQPLLHQSLGHGSGGAPASLGSPASAVPRQRSQRTSASGLLLLEAAAGRSSGAAAAAAILRRERSRSNAGNASPVWAAYAAAAAAAAGGDRSSGGGIPVGRGFSGSGGLLMAAAYGAVATGSRNNSSRQLRRGISGTDSGGGGSGAGAGTGTGTCGPAAADGLVSAAAPGLSSGLVEPGDVFMEVGGAEEPIAGLPLSVGGSGSRLPAGRIPPDGQQQSTAWEWETRQAAAQSPGGSSAPLAGRLAGGRASAADLFSITEHRHEETGGEGPASQNFGQGLGHASGRQAAVASAGTMAAEGGMDGAEAASHTTILPAAPAPAVAPAPGGGLYERRSDASPYWSPGRRAAPGTTSTSASAGGGGSSASKPDLHLTLPSPPLQQLQPLQLDGSISPSAFSAAVPRSPTGQAGRGAGPAYITTCVAPAGPPVHGGLPSTSFTRPPSRLSIAGVSGTLPAFPSVGSPPSQHHLQYPLASSPGASLHAQQQRRRTTIGAPGSAFAGSSGAAAAALATGAGPPGPAGVRQSEPGRLAAPGSAVDEARSGGGPAAAAAACGSSVSVPL